MIVQNYSTAEVYLNGMNYGLYLFVRCVKPNVTGKGILEMGLYENHPLIWRSNPILKSMLNLFWVNEGPIFNFFVKKWSLHQMGCSLKNFAWKEEFNHRQVESSFDFHCEK